MTHPTTTLKAVDIRPPRNRRAARVALFVVTVVVLVLVLSACHPRQRGSWVDQIEPRSDTTTDAPSPHLVCDNHTC